MTDVLAPEDVAQPAANVAVPVSAPKPLTCSAAQELVAAGHGQGLLVRNIADIDSRIHMAANQGIECLNVPLSGEYPDLIGKLFKYYAGQGFDVQARGNELLISWEQG